MRDKDCILAFGIYMAALTGTSVAGFALGYPQALWVWILPLLTGFGCDEDEQ